MRAVDISPVSMLVLPSKDSLKKWLSSFLVFVIFAGQTFQIPFSLQKALAAGSDAPNLVSIIVSESTNSWNIKTLIRRYANDIQAAMTNTRVVIVEVDDNIAPHNIAALNEKLYYEGDGNGISRLVGTILIGKLPIPVVHKWSSAFLSIYPYTDFDEKIFIYDPKKGYYDAVSNPVSRDVPEIWHGVIQPNTGSEAQDEEKLAEFLNKTHDFYTKSGVFADMSQEPYVFYLDITHDQKSASPESWKSYNLWLEYLEEIAYNRFSKHLAKTMYDKYEAFQKSADGIDTAELAALGIQIPDINATDFSSAPDIQTRTAIMKIAKQFYEVINEKYVGDILKFVYNTGRYGDGKDTRVDIGVVLISKRDKFVERALKDANTAVENAIDSLVKTGLSQDIALPVAIKVKNYDTAGKEDYSEIAPVYQNYLYGKTASGITNAKECSIVRGSSLPVEANRGYNILNIEKDLSMLTPYPTVCFPGGTSASKDFWGWNTPLNLQTSDMTAADFQALQGATSPDAYAAYEDKLKTDFKLKNNSYKDYVIPTFDLYGQKEFTGATLTSWPLHILTPTDCLVENFIADPYSTVLPDESQFYHPKLGNAAKFVCIMKDSKGVVGHKYFPPRVTTWSTPTNFPTAVAGLSTALGGGTLALPACTIAKFSVGSFSTSFGRLCDVEAGGGSGVEGAAATVTGWGKTGTELEYVYQKIPSWIEHKSPTTEEYGSALKGMSTPSLAQDRDRYIDFIWPSGSVVKIEYPNFFRLTWPDEQNLTPEIVNAKIKELLDAKSSEINGIIQSQNPSTSPNPQAYNILKSGAFPTGPIDLYTLLASNGNTLSTLIDTIVWNNLSNATSKYAFVLENQLDRDGNRDYSLIGHKKGYELGYIAGSGDAQNMYVKVDPESKATPPRDITDIQADYSSLVNSMDAANMSEYTEWGGKFKCWPPEGVPIWQWLPAVFCWLGTLLPPTIESGSCGPALWADRESDRKHFVGLDSNWDGKADWQQDANKNGIIDGYEWIKDGDLKLSSEFKRVGYRTSSALTAELRKDGHILAHDSFNEVYFDIEKIVLKKWQHWADGTVVNQDKIVYVRGGTGESGSIETLGKYVVFSPIAVRAEAGVAKYTVQSIDRDIDISLDVTISPKDKNGTIAFTKKSDTLLLEVRSEALSIVPNVEFRSDISSIAPDIGTENPTTFKAGTVTSASFAVSVTKPNSDTLPEGGAQAKGPIEIRIIDDVDGSTLQSTERFSGNTYTYTGELLKKAGIYRFEFIDAENRYGTVTMNVLPADPSEIVVIPSSNIFVKGQKDTILVQLKDSFGNLVKGDLVQIDGTISSGGFFVQNRDTKIRKGTVEGVSSFDISSNDGGQDMSLKFSVTDSTGRKIEWQTSVKSIDSAKIKVDIANRETVIAGGNETAVEVKVTDRNGLTINGFNGIASIDFPENSGTFNTEFIRIENGTSSGSWLKFKPGTVAVIDGKIDVQIPWIKDIEGGALTVFPNLPMRVGLISDAAKMEATPGLSTAVRAELFDRYGNLAYNHAPGYTATFKVPTGYGKFGSITTGPISFDKGVAIGQLTATSNPGTIYYIAEVSPWLEANSFTVTDDSGTSATIRGYSKNVGFVESYYLWNAEKLRRTNYNVLYTALLGADYGNVTVPNYLAGELLFNSSSSSLAVTSLLNDAKKKSEIVQMTPGGKLTAWNSSLAKISIGSNRNRSTLDIFDPFKKENIGRFYLNTKNETDLFACPSSDADNLDACDTEGKNAYIVMKWLGTAKVIEKNGVGQTVGSPDSWLDITWSDRAFEWATLSLMLDETPVLEIASNGNIRKYPSVTLEVDPQESKNFLSINVSTNGTKIGRLGIKWDSETIELGTPETLDSVLSNNPGKLVYESISPRYSTEQSFLGKSSYGARGIKIFSQEDSDSSQVDRNLIGSSDKQGFEESEQRQGIGFGNGNNSLLEFAAQASVGESTRASATYSQITLGDPVARLPELLSSQNYDRTIGKRIASSRGWVTESYSTMDYNHDGSEDIVVFYKDGKVELLQNYAGVYKSLGYLMYVVDAGPERKGAGDFNGDGYWDVVMIDTRGRLIIVENRKGKFNRITPQILNEGGGTGPEPGWISSVTLPDSWLNGSIMQLETFDMDQDGKTDIVISDDSGELNILYGTNSSDGGVAFTKKNLDRNIWLKLGTGSIVTGGAIRWDGLPEIVPIEQTQYAERAETPPATDAAEAALTLEEQKALLDSKIYYQQSVLRQIPSTAQVMDARITQAAGTDDPFTPGQSSAALVQDIKDNITDTIDLAASWSVDISALKTTTIEEKRTFIRSEFADGKDVLIEKKYIDTNGGNLQSGESINVDIVIQNAGSTPLNQVSYLDSYEKSVFRLGDTTSYSVLNESGVITGSGTLNELTEGEFDFQFDNLSIPAGKSITLRYSLFVSSISFGKFKVGILESDDVYGDVSMNANAICGEEEIMWKSVQPAPRSYEKIKKEIIPKWDATGEQKWRFTDFNQNGNPDYIDLLQGDGNEDSIGSTLWDPTTHGVLVFREVPYNGVIDGTSIEIGRIVANAETEHIQSNPVSGSLDTPVLSESGLDQLARDADGISVGNVGDSWLPACGAAGTITSDLKLVGIKQEYKREEIANIKSKLKIRARGKSSTIDSAGNVTSTSDCQVSINSDSDPSWNGQTVEGIGWKILTKSTFSHFSLAGTQADLIDSAAGIPDSHEPAGEKLFSFNPGGNLSLNSTGISGTIDLGGMSDDNIDKINSALDTIVQWLWCGFGGGSCLSLPMNWAPLAPGSAPVVFGNPIWSLTPDTGYPVFSALTGNQTTCGSSPCCLPSIFPVKKQAFIPGPICGTNSAGGKLGTWAPTNFFRFFITPTITGSVGIAACFGGPAKITGKIPPKAISPLVPGGNCVVAAKPLAGCKDDGSDGSIQDLGSTDGTLNAGSCKSKDANNTLTDSDKVKIRDYIRGNHSLVTDIVSNAAGRGTFRMPRTPLFTMGAYSGVGGSNFEVSIDPSNITNFDKGIIQKIQLDRVSAFPDFIMDWANRQLEEVANKLTSLPTLYIIKPDFRWLMDSGWNGFADNLTNAYSSGEAAGSPVLGNEMAGRSVSGVKAAYEFMSRLPILKFEKTTLNVSYPDIGKEDLIKLENSFKATKKQWENEIREKKWIYERTATKEGLDASVFVRAEALVGGIDANIRMIEEYKKFPEKLAKYLTWKERYAKQILCNITAIQNVLDGFITKNALRYKAWVEFAALLKNILKGWQLIPELFYRHEAECGVCRNERNDSKHFKFKLIKAVIPPIPIIKFPKWPDIVLDLHMVRLGLRIAMPEFIFTPTPIVLPNLPKLGLPTLPTVGINLPGIPTLPSIPPLPELPDLPSLPIINLPELPPPPTIPKLFGGIKFTLNILKIVAKVLCILRTSPFVPEWRAGDLIAQITERQGKLWIDFLDIEFPQFNASFVDAIKVLTFVNLEFQVDFILEMARSTFEPVNAFTANFNGMISTLGGNAMGNVDLRWLNPGRIEVNVPAPGSGGAGRLYPMDTESESSPVRQYAKFLAQAFVKTIRQWQQYANENADYQDIRENLVNELEHVHAAPGTAEFSILESMREWLRERGDSEAERLRDVLLAESNEKFGVATEYVKSELHETNLLLAELSLVQQGRKSLGEVFGKWTRGNATLTNSIPTMTTESEVPNFEKFDTRTHEAYLGLSKPDKWQEEIRNLADSIRNTMSVYSSETEKKSLNLAAATSTTASADSFESWLASYQYRWIYVVENNRQTRLFDYTNDLLGDERAILVDRLGNGAKEYVYKSGDALYLKTKLGNSTPRPVTESVPTLSISDIFSRGFSFLWINQEPDLTLEPTAPNHFVERFAASWEIDFSFRPADNEKHSIFRLEFYDYIDRFDRRMRGETFGSMDPITRVGYVDLVPKLTNETIVSTETPGLIYKKPYATYSNGRWEGSMVGAEYRILGAGQKIRVSSNRSIYADGGWTRLKYQEADVGDGGKRGVANIGPSGELQFLVPMDIEVISGNLILIEDSPSITPRVQDLSALSGYPVISGQRIEITRPQARLDIRYYNDAELDMNGFSVYESYSLGSRSRDYQVSLRQDNAWYYAKLGAVTPDDHTDTQITLLSPQAQADKEAPLIQINKGLRAPVYIEHKIDLRGSITDVSGVRDVYFDTDLLTDSNGDGKRDNDRDSESTGSIFRKGNTSLEWYVKPQESLFEKRVKIWVTDDMGNTANRETTLSIYAPTPNIQSQTGSLLIGKIDESIDGEPVSIVRYRNGKITPIGSSGSTFSWGTFKIDPNVQASGDNFIDSVIHPDNSGSGVIVRSADGTKIADINEKTGVITLVNPQDTISVIGASVDTPVQIRIMRGEEVLYSQSYAVGNSGKIESAADLNDAIARSPDGVGVVLDDAYRLSKNSASSASLPSGAFVVDSDKKAVFGIAKDGNIYLLNPGLRLEYRTEQNHFAIDVRDRSGRLIAKVYYVFNAEYVIK